MVKQGNNFAFATEYKVIKVNIRYMSNNVKKFNSIQRLLEHEFIRDRTRDVHKILSLWISCLHYCISRDTRMIKRIN